MKRTQQYSVVLLFNEDGTKVLLQKKDRTAFSGMLNGIGGKIEKGEQPVNGAFREIEEETTVKRQNLVHFTWLGTLTLPEQCDMAAIDKYPELWFFGGVIKDGTAVAKAENATEDIAWYTLTKNTDGMTVPVTVIDNGEKIEHHKLAGDGDLIYFINTARRLLFNK